MAKKAGRNVHHQIRKNQFLKKIFIDKEFRRLIDEVNSENEEEYIKTIWDFDQGIMLSKNMFLEQEMFGESKYKYLPNIGVYNVRVWSGLYYLPLSMAATPEIESLLEKCEVQDYVYFETDSNGFKKTEFSSDSTSFIVFFLGDSFTDGVWVDSKAIFANQFGVELNSNGIKSTPVNLGVNGYSALEMSWMLEEYSPLLHPHIVIVNLFPNDVHVDFIKVVKGEGIPESSYTKMFTSLQRMKKYCLQSDIMFVVSMIPAKAQLKKLHQHGIFQDRVKAWSETENVILLDPRNYFDSIGVENIYFSWDLHFSPQGHKHYAKFLYHELNPFIAERYSKIF